MPSFGTAGDYASIHQASGGDLRSSGRVISSVINSLNSTGTRLWLQINQMLTTFRIGSPDDQKIPTKRSTLARIVINTILSRRQLSSSKIVRRIHDWLLLLRPIRSLSEELVRRDSEAVAPVLRTTPSSPSFGPSLLGSFQDNVCSLPLHLSVSSSISSELTSTLLLPVTKVNLHSFDLFCLP
jgi:hypothetical protein